ncbi:MAG: hypothetical protein DCC71_25870, partial [Proteobacteria bacterium]
MDPAARGAGRVSDALAFSPAANPDAYVPWTGAEQAFEALTRWASESGAPVCLVAGPPGMGKTLLLKRLAAQAAASLRAVRISYPDCDVEALRGFLRESLEGAPPCDSDDALIAAAPGAGFLLLLDEGELLPDATAQWLRELAERAAGRLRIAVAVTRDERCAELAARFGDACEVVRLAGAMSRADVEAHVRAELERAGVDPGLRARFDAAAIDELHARSEGVPALVQTLASARLFEAQRAGELAARRPPRLARRAPVA